MEKEETISGATLVAESLKRQGVEWVFGVVGIPIMEVGFALQAVGIRYVGMRNEQAVSKACKQTTARRNLLWEE